MTRKLQTLIALTATVGGLAVFASGCMDDSAVPADENSGSEQTQLTTPTLDPSMLGSQQSTIEGLGDLEVSVESIADADDAQAQQLVTVATRKLVDGPVPEEWKQPIPEFQQAPTQVDDSLSAWLGNGGDPTATRNAIVSLRWLDDGQPSARTLQLLSQLGGSEVTFAQAQAQWRAVRHQRIAAAVAPFAQLAATHNLSWSATDSSAADVFATFTRAQLSGLITSNLAYLIEAPASIAEVADDASARRVATSSTTYVIDGIDLQNLIQSDQFYRTGIDGSGLTAVVTEGGADKINTRHLGFQSSAATGLQRRAQNCSSGQLPNCNDRLRGVNSSNNDWHATGVAGILAGDVSQGQLAPWPAATQAQAVARSGVARGASILGISNIRANALQLATNNPQSVVVFSRSASAGSASACERYNGVAQNADAVFESGIAFVKSAGNRNNDTGSWPLWDEPVCNVTGPGQAAGAFTVGSYYFVAGQASDPSAIRADDLATTVREDVSHREGSVGSESSMGGNLAGRTLVDIVAPAAHINRYLSAYSPAGAGVPPAWAPRMGATSAAAPVVSGAAVLFRDWSDSVGGLAHFPGILYSRLLLMGDGWDGLNGYLTKGFSRRSGAGRLRMRKYNGDGLDAPFVTKAGWVCVGQNETVQIPLNGGNAFNGDMDSFKVVSWNYKSSLQGNLYFNRIALSVWSDAGSGWAMVDSDNSRDNKHRLIFEPENASYDIRLYGTDVSGSDPNCSAGKQRVYYAMVAEDSDREPGEDLCDVRLEMGDARPCEP